MCVPYDDFLLILARKGTAVIGYMQVCHQIACLFFCYLQALLWSAGNLRGTPSRRRPGKTAQALRHGDTDEYCI